MKGDSLVLKLADVLGEKPVQKIQYKGALLLAVHHPPFTGGSH